MSQGLTWIAGRRTPLLALVALIALLAAAAYAFAPVKAAPPGDLTFTLSLLDEADNIVQADNTDITVLLTATFTVDKTANTVTDAGELTDDTEDDEDLTNLQSDDVHANFPPRLSWAASEVIVGRPWSFGDTNSNTVDIVANPSFETGDCVDDDNASTAKTADGVTTFTCSVSLDAATIQITKGSSGTITVSTDDIVVTEAADNQVTDDEEEVSTLTAESLVITIGDAPPISDVALSLSEGETGTEKAARGNSVGLDLSILSETGDGVDGSSLAAIVLSTNLPGSTVTALECTPALSCSPASDELGMQTEKTSGKIAVTVSSAATGVATVSATVYGKDGTSHTDSVEVTFTGNAESIEIDEASASILNFGTGVHDPAAEQEGSETTAIGDPKAEETNDDRDILKLAVSAADNAGNAANLPSRFTEKVLDPDGKTAKGISATYARDAKDLTKGAVTLDVDADVKKPLDIGDYTVELKSGKLEAVQSFIVAGDAANVEASYEGGTTLGSRITVTATVTDADGNPAVDGTPMTWTESKTTLAATKEAGKTKDGAATANYVVVAAGTGFVTVESGTGADVVVIVTGAAAVDEPDPEPVDGLSRTQLNNFASWSGEGSVSASELLAGISGASGVLYYDGDSWQRYGVVDGQVIPGSRDFTVRDGDVIWISG